MTQDSLANKNVQEYSSRTDSLDRLYLNWRKTFEKSELDLDSEIGHAPIIAYLKNANSNNPDSVDERCTQLFCADLLNLSKKAPEYLDLRIKHTCWLIENDADHPMLSRSACYSFPSKANVEAINQAWLKRLKSDSSQFVLQHAAAFFVTRNPKLSMQLIEKASRYPRTGLSMQQMFALSYQLKTESQTWLDRTKAKRVARLVELYISKDAAKTYREKNLSFLLVYFMCAVLMTYLYLLGIPTPAPRGLLYGLLYIAAIFYLFSLEFIIRFWAFSFFDLLPISLSSYKARLFINRFGTIALALIFVAILFVIRP